MAAAGSHHHVAVLLQDDVGAVVEVEHRDGVELGRSTARLGYRLRIYEVDLKKQIHRRGKNIMRLGRSILGTYLVASKRSSLQKVLNSINKDLNA